MKNLLCLVGLLMLSCSTASAQEVELHAPRADDSFFGPAPDRRTQVDSSSGYPTYESPRQLVIRNAARKAAQRRERMATNARYGYSPSRPPSSSVPWMGSPAGTYRRYTNYPGFLFPRGLIRF